jgi:type IV pilus assembly protein PilQ
MNNKQGNIMLNKMGRSLCINIGWSLCVFIFQIASATADDPAITGVDFATLPGDKLQIQLEMNSAAITPKVFHTDNPARIALDFPGVKNALDKKMYPINQGAVRSIYVAEAADRVRVVVNLTESTPFQTKVVGNKILLTLTRATAVMPAPSKSAAQKSTLPVAANPANSAIATLMPEQIISGFDFKRGENGEGRILVSLANPNTLVNTREEGGKVIINFSNTRLPANLAKRLDVSEFATPVKFIEATASSRGTTVTVATQNSLYDYSLFQSDGLLTVEFRPLSNAEKEALDRTRVKYTGERLSLNFQDIEIRSVIAILAEFTGQNVVAGDDVTGTITLKLDDVPWDEALAFIMMTKELGKFETGNVTLISPLDKIKSYKQKQQETEAVVEQLDPLVTEYISINYAKAENFRNLLNGRDTGTFGSCGVPSTALSGSGSSSSSGGQSGQSQGQGQYQSQGQSQGQGAGATGSGGKDDKFSLLSSRGSALVDARTNTLVVRETAKKLEEIKTLINKLDVPVRQVMIESRIVIASNTFARDLGVRFGVAGTAEPFGTSGGVGSVGRPGTVNSINGSGILNNGLVDLATATTPYGALGMTLARGADYVLNLELSALQDQGLGELVSNPRVMTSDRCLATIKQGVQLPYQTTSGNFGTTTIFVDAALQLNVLPQITPSGSVIMGLRISKDAPGAATPDGIGIDTRQIQTSVQVMDGETVVLGGVFEGTQRNNTNKVPFFGDLPGVGFLFKRTNKQDDKSELLIFVTPKIVKNNIVID